MSKKSTRAFLHEIMCLPDFDEEVKFEACKVFSHLEDKKNRRCDGRKELILRCLYQAYIELDHPHPPTPAAIGKSLGLTPSQSNAAFKKRMKFIDGFQPRSPTKDLSEKLRRAVNDSFGLDKSYVDDMVEVFEEMLKSDRSLTQEQADPLIAAFLLTYFEHNSAYTDPESLAEDKFHLRSSTVQNRKKRVDTVYKELL